MNIGIIGTGNMGRNHLRIMNGFKNRVDGISIFDTDAELLHQLSYLYEVDHHHSIDSLLAKADAVIIAAPTSRHYELAEACLRLNKDILIEKPMTATVDEAVRLADLVDKTGCLCMVGFVERFNPVILYVKEYLKDKEIKSITSERISKLEKSRSFDVDVIVDLMIHDIDLVLSMIDSKPAKVFAASWDPKLDEAQAVIQFENAAVAAFNASRSSSEKIRRLMVSTPGENIKVDFLKYKVERVRQVSIDKCFSCCDYRITGESDYVIVEGEPLYLELKHFLDCIESRKKPMSNELNGLAALKLAEEMVNFVKESRGYIDTDSKTCNR